MKPSKISAILPMGSIFQNIESEQVAQNIAIILKRTGDEFRLLSRDEYTDECKKDGHKRVLYGDPFSRITYEQIAELMSHPITAATICKEYAYLLKE